jgi:hypothetical protein
MGGMLSAVMFPSRRDHELISLASVSVHHSKLYARLLGRREIFSQVSSSIWSEYSLIENSLPHAVQRKVMARQPIRSSTFLPQVLHFMKASNQEQKISPQRTQRKPRMKKEIHC